MIIDKKNIPERTGMFFLNKELRFANNITYISLLLISEADFCLFCKFHKSR